MDCIRCARVNRNSAGNFQLENLHATRTKPDTAYHNIKFRANQTDTKNRKHLGLHKYLQRYLPTLCMWLDRPVHCVCAQWTAASWRNVAMASAGRGVAAIRVGRRFRVRGGQMGGA